MKQHKNRSPKNKNKSASTNLTLIDPHDFSNAESITLDKWGNNPPIIKIYRKFLSDTLITKLMKFIQKKKFDRSGTEEDYGNDSQTSDYRTSWTYFIPERTELSREIKKKVAKILNCRMKDIEPIQIVRYKEGQYYKTHHDSQLDQDNLHRDHTFFVYLNTITNGSGGTTFPYLRARFLPRKGCAVYWRNLRRGDCDGRMRHRGDVVRNAQKYGMNIWIRTPRQDMNPS